jgi:hypothetical protein
MKKIFLLLAIALLTFNGQAQNNVLAKSSMVILVTEAKKNFAKGTSYNDWIKQKYGTAQPTVQEEAFLKDIYGFVVSGKNPETIQKEYSGATMAALAQTKNSTSVFSESNARCGFWCQLAYSIVWWYIDTFVNFYLFP